MRAKGVERGNVRIDRIFKHFTDYLRTAFEGDGLFGAGFGRHCLLFLCSRLRVLVAT